MPRLLVAVLLVAAAACGGSDVGGQGAGARNGTPDPTGISADDPGCRYIVAGNAARATNPGGVTQYLSSAVAEPFACYDKVTFTFAQDDTPVATTAPLSTESVTCSPAYTVEYREAPFGLETAEGKGIPTSTGGFADANAVLYVEMSPAIAVSTFGAKPELAYPGGLRLVFEASAMQHINIVEWVKNLPEGEQTPVTPTTIAGVEPLPQRVVWLIGMDRKRPFTVDCAPGSLPPPGPACPVTACTHISVLIMR
jgi:hypothetical protein